MVFKYKVSTSTSNQRGAFLLVMDRRWQDGRQFWA